MNSHIATSAARAWRSARSMSPAGALTPAPPRSDTAAPTRPGSAAKLPGGGGEAVAHSSVVARHGLSAGWPRRALQWRFHRNTSWNRPRATAAQVMCAFQVSDGWASALLDAGVVQPPVHAHQPHQEHRQEDRVHAHERAPEVQQAEPFVQAPAGHLRKPVIDAGEEREQRARRDQVVEVPDHVERVVQDHVARPRGRAAAR